MKEERRSAVDAAAIERILAELQRMQRSDRQHTELVGRLRAMLDDIPRADFTGRGLRSMKVALDRKCRHENFQSRVKVDRHSADVRVWCDDCGEGFLWLGAPVEPWPARSMLSVEAKALPP